MTRVEELTLWLADRGLTAAEGAELQALLAGESARQAHLRLLRLEGALRGEGRIPPVAADTLEALDQRRTEGLERSVMQAIVALPVPRTRTARPWAMALGALASAAAILLAVHLLRPDRGSQGAEVAALVVEQSGPLVVEMKSGQVVAMAPGQVLHPGQTVRTQSDDGFAVVQTSDGSRFELFGNTAVRVQRRGSQQVELLEGSLRADVRPQPAGRYLRVSTPHAELHVPGTKFDLTAQPNGGTRIHLEVGQVELVRQQEAPTVLFAGVSVFVPAEASPVVMENPQVLSQPSREFSFVGLRNILYADEAGGQILGFTDRRAIRWDRADDRLEARLLGEPNWKSTSVVAASGTTVAILHTNGAQLALWDLAGGASRMTCANPEPRLTVAAVAPDGQWWAYWSSGKQGLRIYRSQGEPVDVSFSGKIASIAVAPDGKSVALGRHDDGYVVDLVDTRSGQAVRQLAARLTLGAKYPLAMAFSGDGRRLAVAVRTGLQVWDVETGTMVAELGHPGSTIQRMALSHDGRQVVASGPDSLAWIWRLEQPDEPLMLATGQPVRGMAFAPDGQSLALFDRTSRVTVWDLPAPGEVK